MTKCPRSWQSVFGRQRHRLQTGADGLLSTACDAAAAAGTSFDRRTGGRTCSKTSSHRSEPRFFGDGAFSVHRMSLGSFPSVLGQPPWPANSRDLNPAWGVLQERVYRDQIRTGDTAAHYAGMETPRPACHRQRISSGISASVLASLHRRIF